MLITDADPSAELQTRLELTVVLFQSFGDLTEDPGVAGDHDGQRQQEQAGKSEHVVGRFMPVSGKTPTCGTLSEVLRVDDGHIVKKEYLRRERNILRHKSCHPRLLSCFWWPYHHSVMTSHALVDLPGIEAASGHEMQ